MSEEEMDTNFVFIHSAGRNNADSSESISVNSSEKTSVETAERNNSADIEGYSLLPDIIWTPDTEMLNSQYGKVIFTNVKDSYSTNEDLPCMYSILSGVEVKDDDHVAIFCVGWANMEEAITWVPAAKPARPNEELSVVFSASQLPTAGTNFFQFCYLSSGEVRGASIPFNFIKKCNKSNKEDKKSLYIKNEFLLDKSPQKNTVSSGEVGLQCVTADAPHNLAVSSTETSVIKREREPFSGPSNEQPVKGNTTRAESSHSGIVCVEQCDLKQYKEEQKLSLKHSYKSHDTQAVPSSQGLTDTEMDESPNIYTSSDNASNDSVKWMHGLAGCAELGISQKAVAQLTKINEDLQKKCLELEQENQTLLTTVNAVREEAARSRARLTSELDKNKTLIENIRRTETEVEKWIQHCDMTRQNNSRVLAEMEAEINNHRVKIGQLCNLIIEKDRLIAYMNQKIDDITNHPLTLEGAPPFHAFDAQIDEKLQQQEQLRNGQNAEASPAPLPFNAALRKTRNYYTTFLTDKAEIERKVYALSCTKQSTVNKLRDMKEKKDELTRLEYQYYTALQDMHGVQNDASMNILGAISNVTAEQRNLDAKADMELGMLDELTKRLVINRENTCALKSQAIEVFSKLLESYNHRQEQDSEVGQGEVDRLHILYASLDERFNEVLYKIADSVNKTFYWS